VGVVVGKVVSLYYLLSLRCVVTLYGGRCAWYTVLLSDGVAKVLRDPCGDAGPHGHFLEK
jgi:hypothetical protein